MSDACSEDWESIDLVEEATSCQTLSFLYGHNQQDGADIEDSFLQEIKRNENEISANIEEVLDRAGNTEAVVDSFGLIGKERRPRQRLAGEVRGIRIHSERGTGPEIVSVGELRSVLTSEIRRNNLRHRIVHSIYARGIPHGRADEDFDRNLQRPFHGTIFIVGIHAEHYHVIHDCSWGSSTCRCARVRAIERQEIGESESDIVRSGRRHRYNRKITGTSSWNIDHWINLLLYLDSAGRRISSIEISGRPWLRYHRGKPSTLFQGSAFRIERGLEDVRLSDQTDCEESGGPYSYPGNEIDSEHYGEIERKRRLQEDDLQEQTSEREQQPSGSKRIQSEETGGRRRGGDRGSVASRAYATSESGSTSTEKRSQSLLGYLQHTVFSPPKALFHSRLWLKSKYRYTDKKKNYFNITFEELKLFYVERSTLEIWYHFLDCDPLKLFFASENTHSYYYSIKESVHYLECLLMYQFAEVDEDIKQFLTDLYNILDKTRSKVNTFFVLGEPNSGKNFFFDCVVHFYVNFGIITNWNRHNQFPLQDCTNRRVLYWNEPNFEDGVEETLKMLFGGDQCGARIKYEGDSVIQRTPVIVLANSDCFPRNQAFRTRMIKYEWMRCAQLKHLNKKPNPLAWAYLLARWDIIKWRNMSYDFSSEDISIFVSSLQ